MKMRKKSLDRLDLSFEKPGRTGGYTRKRSNTPMSVSVYGNGKNGLITMNRKWLEKAGLLNLAIDNGVAIQVKGKLETYVIFNAPLDAPKFYPQKSSVESHDNKKVAALKFSASSCATKILRLFHPSGVNATFPATASLGIENVGVFEGGPIVFRLTTFDPKRALSFTD